MEGEMNPPDQLPDEVDKVFQQAEVLPIP